jgi:Family of unknown function (DUF5908)
MAIEIRELIVRAEVVSKSKDSASTSGNGLSAQERALLIEECAEHVMRALNRQKNR